MQISTSPSTGTLTVSQSPGSCTNTQTATAQPTYANSTVVGLNFVLTKYSGYLFVSLVLVKTSVFLKMKTGHL